MLALPDNVSLGRKFHNLMFKFQDNVNFTKQMTAKSKKIVMDAEHGNFCTVLSWLNLKQGRPRVRSTGARSSSTEWSPGRWLRPHLEVMLCPSLQLLLLQDLHKLVGGHRGLYLPSPTHPLGQLTVAGRQELRADRQQRGGPAEAA